MNPFNFEFHKELNPEVWDGDRLKPEVRKHLLGIAEKFVHYIGVPLEPVDVIFTGSLANYNYTEYSDIDLHILVDKSAIGGSEAVPPQVFNELFTAKKTLWNENHEIQIAGFDVELYVQDVNEMHASTGVYSVGNDEWVKKPSADDPKVDEESVKMKAQSYMDMIDHALAQEDCEAACLSTIKEGIKGMRKAGLSAGGEFSTENLAFKALRRNGYIEKLLNAEREALDATLSLEALATDLVDSMLNEIAGDDVVVADEETQSGS